MEIIINNTTPQPIYEQIYHQIKEAIHTGALAADHPLPSIRALAKELSVSVITTKRAYDDLERDGYVYSIAGKGCYVAPRDESRIREQALNELQQHLREALHIAPSCGMSTEAIIMLLRMMDKENI